MNFKILMTMMLLALTLVFPACQSNNGETPASSSSVDNNSTVGGSNPTPEANVSTDIKTLSLVNDTLTITGGKDTKDIYVVAFNANGSTNTVGEIEVQYPDTSAKYGFVTPSSGVIKDGRVNFQYTAPDDITDLNNTRAEFKFYDKSNPNVSVLLHVDFNATGNYVTTDPVLSKLILSQANLTINSDNQREELVLQAYTDQSTTNISTTLYLKYPQDLINSGVSIGELPSSLEVVDGTAKFSYSGVPNLSQTIADLNAKGITNPIAVNIYDPTTGTNTDLNLNFSQPAADAKYANYELSVIPENNFTISTPSQKQVIDVYLEDNATNKPVAGELVNLDFFNGAKGSMNLFSATTDANGHVAFEYTAPSDISDLNGTSLSFNFALDGNTSTTVSTQAIFAMEKTKMVISDDNITVTKNGESVAIDVYVYDKDNVPYNGGNVKITYPDTVLSGTDIGSFASSSVAVTNGKASFVYTAPSPLEANTSTSFTFYFDLQPELSKKDVKISFEPDAGQVVIKNYTLKATYETTQNLETTKGMTFYVADEDGVKVNDSNMTSVEISSLNANLGILQNTDGTENSSFTVTNKNNVQMNLKTGTVSGVIPIKVLAKFKDANNNDQNLTKVFNVVVLSGPPTAMSLSYASTSQDSEHAKFIENWVLTVTDKYNNRVNTNPAVSMGMITGYATSSSTPTSASPASYLYFDDTTGNGTLTDATPDTFDAAQNSFNNVDLVNDVLVLFGGDGYKFNAYGKWDIDSKQTPSQLTLKDDFNGSNVTGLGYAVGHNFRNEVCSGNQVVANVYPKDNNFILSSTGSLIIQVEYDYYLVGKTTVLWANIVGKNNNLSGRIGLGRKVTLRGQGLTGGSENFAKDQIGVRRLYIDITNTVEKYKNANFGYAVEVTGDGNTYDVVGSSMDSGITSCVNSGVAYVDVNITNAANTGVVKLVKVLPSNEF